jgi:hypothetical protein
MRNPSWQIDGHVKIYDTETIDPRNDRKSGSFEADAGSNGLKQETV